MPSLGPIHTLVFDLDDTLYPERDFVMSGFEAVGTWLEQQRAAPGFAELARRHFDAGNRGRTFDAVLARMGLEATPPLVQQLIAVYRGHRPTLELPADSAAFLDWAKPRFRLALISDGYLEVQKRKFHALGTGRWIPVAVFTDAMGRPYWKPHPWAFQEVMRRIPGHEGGYVYIADNPAKDFAGARSAGWKTVRLRAPAREHSHIEAGPGLAADLEVPAFDHLRPFLIPSGSTSGT